MRLTINNKSVDYVVIENSDYNKRHNMDCNMYQHSKYQSIDNLQCKEEKYHYRLVET